MNRGRKDGIRMTNRTDRAHTYLLGLVLLAMLVAYHVLPVILWGPEP